jgi:hypothetical protein
MKLIDRISYVIELYEAIMEQPVHMYLYLRYLDT